MNGRGRYPITVMGDAVPAQVVPDPLGARTPQEVFNGCTNRSSLAAYLVASHVEGTYKGFVLGVGMGLVLAFGVGVYLRSEGHL